MTSELIVAIPSRDFPTRETIWALEHNTPKHRRFIAWNLPVEVACNSLFRRVLDLDPMPPFVLACADDAWWSIGTVETLIAELREHPEVDVVVPMLSVREANKPCAAWRETGVGAEQMSVGMNCAPNSLVAIQWADLHVALVRTSVLPRMGEDPFRPDGPFFEDLTFCKRLREVGGTLALSTHVEAAHVDADSGLAFFADKPAAVITGPDSWRYATADEVRGASATPRVRDYGPVVNAAYRYLEVRHGG